MKILKIALWALAATGLIFSFAFGAGDVAKGKILFKNPKLGGGTVGNSCNSCHPDGKGLDKAADRKDLVKMVNLCIENALKGKAIDPKSEDIANLVAYLKSLKGKKPAGEAPKKK